MDTRNLISLSGVLLVLGAAGYYWGMGSSNNHASAGDTVRRPDYVITNIHSLETDEQGRVMRRLQSPQLRHYDKPQDESEMDTPLLTLYELGREAWQINSQHGDARQQNTEVLLTGQVHAERRDPTAIPVSFDTDHLLVYPRDQRMTTDGDVVVTSTLGHLTGTGLDANMKTGDIVLHQNVKGNYAPAPPAPQP
jgi:lipopolysaccharide export system protein LptC